MVGVQRGQDVQGREATPGRPVPVAGRRDRRREVPPGQRVRPRRQTPPPGGAAGRLARVLAVVTVWATTTGGLGVLVGQAAGGVRAAGPARVEDAVTLVAGSAALGAAWWLAVAALASVGAALLGRHRPGGVLARAAAGVAGRTAPAGLRRAVVLAVGLSLAGAAPALAAPRGTGPTAAGPVACAPAETPCLDPSWGATLPATATATAPVRTTTAGRVTVRATTPAVVVTGPAAVAAAASAPVSLDPGWVPAAPGPVVATRPPVGMPGPALRPRHAARAEVVVRAGDTLWTIVERHLGPHATASEVAAEWPRWHAANRASLGDDPDRLFPGQILLPPGATARDRVRPPGGSGPSARSTDDAAASAAGTPGTPGTPGASTAGAR